MLSGAVFVPHTSPRAMSPSQVVRAIISGNKTGERGKVSVPPPITYNRPRMPKYGRQQSRPLKYI